MQLMVFFVFLFGLAGGAVLDPFLKGPCTDVIRLHWAYNDTGLYKHVEVYAPANCTGSHPVIYFSHSFAGTITVMSVETYLHHLVSYGYTIIAPWRANVGPNYTVEWINPTIDFAEEHVLPAILEAGANPDYVPDFSRMFAIGHSAGNHILVNYFKRKGCRNFIGSVLLSPVDGPLDFCITPGSPLNYEMPTLVKMAGLDPIPASPLQPACAPRDISNTRFYNAMAGNKWFINATDYGHADFFEPSFLDLIEFLNFCETDETTDKIVYTDYIAGICVAFMEALKSPEENCDMMLYLEDMDFGTVNSTGYYQVDEATRCTPGCSWTPLPYFE